jgi:hypothetical protein
LSILPRISSSPRGHSIFSLVWEPISAFRLFGILKRTIRMIEALYKSDAYVAAVKVSATLVIIASAWELLRLHGIVLSGTVLLEIFYAALIGVAARVLVELSPKPRHPAAHKTEVTSLTSDAVGARFRELDIDDDSAAAETRDEGPPYRHG